MKIQGYCGAPCRQSDQSQKVFLQINYGQTTYAAIIDQNGKPSLVIHKDREAFPEHSGPIIQVPEFIKGLYLSLPSDCQIARNDFLKLEISKEQMPKKITEPCKITKENILQHISAPQIFKTKQK